MSTKADQSHTTLAVRAEPVQQRSAERITALLDAAAELIDQGGIDGLTTSDVATRSASSVGVVYRYFPNIQSLLKALSARNAERFAARIQSALPSFPQTVDGAMEAVIESYVDLARTEPGFRALRFGDVIDDRFLDGVPRGISTLPELFLSIVVERRGLTPSPELAFDLEVLVEIGDALMARAFRDDPKGDERYIAKLREIASEYIHRYTSA